MSPLLYCLALACTKDATMVCTRELEPVCGNGTTYTNLCMANAVGFTGRCAKFVRPGACDTPARSFGVCAPGDVMSEQGRCVRKPWSDFVSCAEEHKQGACPGGRDPNTWVAMHCATTCGTF